MRFIGFKEPEKNLHIRFLIRRDRYWNRIIVTTNCFVVILECFTNSGVSSHSHVSPLLLTNCRVVMCVSFSILLLCAYLREGIQEQLYQEFQQKQQCCYCHDLESLSISMWCILILTVSTAFNVLQHVFFTHKVTCFLIFAFLYFMNEFPRHRFIGKLIFLGDIGQFS